MYESDIYRTRDINVYKHGFSEHTQAAIVRETPLTVFLNHNELATMICSPGAYVELGAGFLLSEGLIRERSDITEMNCRDEEGLLWVETNLPTPQTNNFLRRHMASCCGKGRAALYFINDARQLQAVQSNTRFSAQYLLDLMRQMEEKSKTFRQTGGVHSAALADHADLLFMYEDIGRHNAVDKVLGRAFLNEISTSDKCLLLSGRIASEILIKAARSNIPLVLSRSAPTELTVDLAEELNIAVVGFARGESLNIYSHPEKIET